MHDSPHLWKELLRAGLRDDGWPWDWTSLGIRGTARARVVARSAGVWAAEGLAAAAESVASEDLGLRLSVRGTVRDGARIAAGRTVCEWRGDARAILAIERPFLNLAAYAGGIATSTRELVDAVRRSWRSRRPAPRVTATRKTLPAYRDLAIHAVRAGGGKSHRVSLSGGILVKENHVAAAGGIGRAVSAARASAPHGLKVEVEVRDLAELRQAVAASADGVLLDNFTPAQVRGALKLLGALRPRPFVEVSGGIHSANVSAYALEGVDVISSGSLTHSVRSLDLSLLVR
jgi:nicotinate-nucleotide pyrophosphorylase (carboxylating)